MSDQHPLAAPEFRAATFNASLNRAAEGALVADLATPSNPQAATVAEIIQRVAPDVLLVNEFDFVPGRVALNLFRDNYLTQPQDTLGLGAAPAANYPYAYVAPSNTGIASGFDLNNNAQVVTTPGAAGYDDDAFGFGAFPGQFGMAFYSQYPILTEEVRTFQTFLWQDMPGARLPDDAATPAPADFYSPEELAVFRLSSKSFWDVPVLIGGKTVHFILLHPTPPVFDGPEDRNGLRNADEIRMAADYVTPGAGGYLYDDQGIHGGLAPGARFVIMGDLNADPLDGDSVDAAVRQVLDAPSVDSSLPPTSPGGPQQSALQGGANATHRGNPLFDTADFADTTPGNLRADYVLPSQFGLAPRTAGVFWPQADDPLFPLVGTFTPSLPGGFPSSDHRLVWTDLGLVGAGGGTTVGGLDFLGQAIIAPGSSFGGLPIGGLSAIAYDAASGQYYALSDDRSADARFYTLRIDLIDGALSDGDIGFRALTTLTDAAGQPFTANTLDPEGLALAGGRRAYLSSEGDATALIDPFVARIGLDGRVRETLELDDKFLPTADRSAGIRNNLAFEALTLSPDGKRLFAGNENALIQDGPAASLATGSASRVIEYDTVSGRAVAEYVYLTDQVQAVPDPAGSFATNGLVELLALDNEGGFLALERSFSTGVGNGIRLYRADASEATDVSGLESLTGAAFEPLEKTLLLDFAELGITLDNVEGMTFGPTLADGRRTLVLVADDNFSPTQVTQFLAFAIEPLIA